MTGQVTTVWVNCFGHGSVWLERCVACAHLHDGLVTGYHLIPIHVLKSALMEGCYNKHLFPVSASFIPFHRCHCICVLSCGCVGLSVRRYLRIFVWCHCNLVIEFSITLWNFGSFFLAFIFRLGSLNFFSKSFVAVITLFTHSYLEFICAGCYCDRFLFVGMVQQTLRKLGRCQMTQLI